MDRLAYSYSSTKGNYCIAFIFSLMLQSADDTIGDLKMLIAAQTGTRSERIILKKWYAFPHLICYQVFHHDFTFQKNFKLGLDHS